MSTVASLNYDSDSPDCHALTGNGTGTSSGCESDIGGHSYSDPSDALHSEHSATTTTGHLGHPAHAHLPMPPPYVSHARSRDSNCSHDKTPYRSGKSTCLVAICCPIAVSLYLGLVLFLLLIDPDSKSLILQFIFTH